MRAEPVQNSFWQWCDVPEILHEANQTTGCVVGVIGPHYLFACIALWHSACTLHG